MPLTLRPGRPEDATICGTICYDAFKAIAEQHNFPSNYPSPEVAAARMAERLTHPGFYAVVAELDGRVVGSNFLDLRCSTETVPQPDARGVEGLRHPDTARHRKHEGQTYGTDRVYLHLRVRSVAAMGSQLGG